MKQRIRTAMLTVAALSTLFVAAPAYAETVTDEAAHAAQLAKAAPADEYFGPMRLSVLGIRNTIADTTLRLDRAGLPNGDTFKNVTLVEESVHEWESKYPSDTWLPQMVLGLHRAYRKIATDESLQRSVDTAAWLMAKYPKSVEAVKLRGELAEALAGGSSSDEEQPSPSDPAPGVVEPPAPPVPAATPAPLPPYAQPEKN